MAKRVKGRKLTHAIPIPEDEHIEVTRNQITRLLFETHKKCVNATEEVLALKELAKINNLYPNDTNINVLNITNVEHNVNRLKSMSDEDLLQLSGHDKELFALPPIDAKYEEVNAEEAKVTS